MRATLLAAAFALGLAGCKYFKDAPEVVDPPAGTAVIAQLDRGACFGPCPVYSLTVFADGTVIYDGTTHVKVTGRRSRVLKPPQLDQLVASFERHGFAGMAASYEKTDAEDPPTISLTYRGKIVNRAPGDPRTPPALLAIEDELEHLTGAEEWTGIDSKIRKREEKERYEKAKRF